VAEWTGDVAIVGGISQILIRRISQASLRDSYFYAEVLSVPWEFSGVL
jgi:hypothetical protein